MRERLRTSGHAASEPDLAAQIRWARITLAATALVGLGTLTGYTLHPWKGWLLFVSSFAASLVIALAALMAGCVIGFLFGIPKTLQGSDQSNRAVRYLANTNLEQISDWLTKIIVGVGLVELRSLPGYLDATNTYLAPALARGEPAPIAIVGAILTYWCLFGFLVGYVGTRLLLPKALRASESEALKEAVREVATEVSYESRMITALYREGGYEDAIQIADEYRNQHGEPANDRMWLYQACAWGQKLQNMRAAGADPAEIERARGNALEAARRAVRSNESNKALLRALSDPEKHNYPPDENDLESLRDDPEFLKIVTNRRP
jgi:hypothetical protein